MIEQFTDGKYNTFDAYKYLGMQKDYREYSSISDIINIMNIKPKFVLLTNNPDKIDAMKSLNI
jgi:3,4-dihydroxy 2-butanone 4-phosphate synthase/GTP cyclohydrolase II